MKNLLFPVSIFRYKIPAVIWHGAGNYMPQTTYLSHPYETGSRQNIMLFHETRTP